MVSSFSRRSFMPALKPPVSGTSRFTRLASTPTASRKGRLSSSMMKLMAPPPFPQPKHLKICLSGETEKEGVFSEWKGHSPQ